MSTAICPYCRGPIEPGAEEAMVCAGCGTPHHTDCYAENGGCTVFGCSAAPAEEAKLSVSGNDLLQANARSAVPAPLPSIVPSSSVLGLERRPAPPVEPAPPSPVVRVKAPPPPMPEGATAPAPIVTPVAQLPAPLYGSRGILFGTQPPPSLLPAIAPLPHPGEVDFAPNPVAKNRTTFIVLGVLLGPLGAHNFYAGYKGKATAQLCISVFTMGLASPMAWIWAVIDVCTVDRDYKGIKFRQ